MNNNYINYMKNKLIDNNIWKNRLNVELLESISNINNNLDLEQIVEIFNSFWVNVFIDDLWTWNSNINRLLNVKNIHSVKIDWWIIQWLSENNLEWESNENKLKRIEKAKEIITLIVQIAENQDPKQKVIAEYVSNKYIFETVKKLWVHYSQWYYIWKASKNLFLKNK
jgi:EAL domain-containing protein (putative c-di-GMP-specific phosphodiesterase class I)